MKINHIISETTAGSVASVAMPLGSIKKRTNEENKVKGLEPAEKVMFGKSKKKGPYQNSLVEGRMKELSMDLGTKNGLSDENFKKKYGKTKQEMLKMLKQKPTEKQQKVDEAKLDEEDIIIVPGHGMKRKNGFVQHGKSRVDHEVEMARSDLLAAYKNAKAIYRLIKNRSEEDGLEGWVQEKIIKANDYLNTVAEYLESKEIEEGLAGAALGGAAGAALTKTPTGAMMGAELGSEIQDKFTNENGGVIAGGGVGEAKGKLTYTPEPTEYGVFPDNKKEFVKTFLSKDLALAHIKKFGGKLVVLDQYGRRMKQGVAEAQIDEKAVSKAQQKFFGAVHAAQKGEKAASPEIAKAKEQVGEAIPSGQYAKLYHSTPAMHLDAILQSGYLAPTTQGYLSLTRDSRLDYGSWGGQFVEFDIDQNAVRQRIKLEPYNHDSTMGGPRSQGGGESEERTRQKIPLRGFVTAMHAPTTWEGEKAGEHYGNLLKKYGVPIIYDIVPRLGEQGVAEAQIDEKAVSKAQQKFFGAVHAAQKGEKAASPEIAKVAKSMTKKAARDFAATKHKGLPEKVKKD